MHLHCPELLCPVACAFLCPFPGSPHENPILLLRQEGQTNAESAQANKSLHAQSQGQRASARLAPGELVWASQAGAGKATLGLPHLYTAQSKMLKEHRRAREMASGFPEQENSTRLEERSQETRPICKVQTLNGSNSGGSPPWSNRMCSDMSDP